MLRPGWDCDASNPIEALGGKAPGVVVVFGLSGQNCARSGAEGEVVLAAVLFTDVVASTDQQIRVGPSAVVEAHRRPARCRSSYRCLNLVALRRFDEVWTSKKREIRATRKR
jgi:hypothetical protein